MKYLRFNTKPHIIVNKKINTILFERVYPLHYDKKDLFKIKILDNLLTYTTKDYPQENLYNQVKLKSLIMSLNTSYRIRGDNLFFTFSMSVPKEGLTDSFSLDNAFKLFVDSINKPNVINNAFDKKAFEREIDVMKSNLNEGAKDYYSKNIDDAMSIYDKEEISGISLIKYRHELDKLTPEILYDFYKELISHNSINIVYGNTTKDRILSLYKKHNLYQEQSFKVEEVYFRKFPNVKKLKEKNIKSDYNQSCLFLGYKVRDYSLEESHYLGLIGDLIDGQECRMLFNALRIENQLVYHYSTNGYIYNGGFVIYVYLSKHNKDKALKVVQDTLALLKDKDFIKANLARVIQGYKYDLIYELDSTDIPYREYTRKIYHSLPGLKETINLYENLDIDSFISFIERLELDTIYFNEGDKDE